MYEDYMQNFYGIPENQNYQDTYDFNSMRNYPFMNINNYGYNQGVGFTNRNMSTASDIDLEELYPEIYKVIYPMIKKVCSKVIGPITREMFEDMVDEVANNFEGNNIDINFNVNNDVKNANNANSINNRGITTKKEEENRETRQSNFARDLIRILLIRELLRIRRRPCFGPNCRPGMGMPPRPPFPRYEL